MGAFGQEPPVRLTGQISMKQTFWIAPIHCASADAVRALCRDGTRVFSALLGLRAPRGRRCRFNERTLVVPAQTVVALVFWTKCR